MADEDLQSVAQQAQSSGHPWLPPNPDDTSDLQSAGFVPNGGQASMAQAPAPATPMQMPADKIVAPPSYKPITSAQALPARGQIEREQIGAEKQQIGSINEQQAMQQAAATKIAEAQAEQKTNDDNAEIDKKVRQMQLSKEWEARDADRATKAAELRDRHVDPTKWYKDKGTAGTIAAAIAQAAGAFAAAMPGSHDHTNHASEIINHAVERDVQAQKDDIDKGFKELDLQGNEDDKKYIRDNHQLAEMDKARITGWEHAGAQIDNIRAATTDAMKMKQLDALKLQAQNNIGALKTKQLDHMTAVGDKLAAQGNAAAAEAKKKAEKLEERRAALEDKMLLDPKIQPKDASVPREQAIAQAAHAQVYHSKENAGAVTVSEPEKGGAGKLSPRIAVRVEAASRGADAAAALVKSNPWTDTAASGGDVPSKIDSVEAAVKSMNPNADTGWMHHPWLPGFKVKMNAVEVELKKHAANLPTLASGGEVENDEIEGAQAD